MKKEKAILLVYGSGGHNEQMKRLYHELISALESRNYNFEVISLCDSDVKHELTQTTYYTPPITHKFSYSMLFLRLPLRAFQIALTLKKINKQYDVDTMISTGPGIAILTACYLKLLRKRIIHIETWSRFYTKSLTGRLMYHISDYFFVQNKELLKSYPKAIYKGRL